MKILVNATAITAGKMTGIERFALRISQELHRIDPGVHVVCARNIPGVGSLEKPGLLAVGNRLLGKREYLLRSQWDQTLFRYRAHRLRPDVVFFPIQDGLIRPPARQVVTVHDLHYLHFQSTLSECSKEIGLVRRMLYRQKMPRVFADSAAVIAVSEATRRDLIERFSLDAGKVHVVYNGYDQERFRVVTEPETVLRRYGLERDGYFLFVGSVLRHKNLSRLLDAFAAAKSSAALVVAGVCKDPQLLQQLMAQAETLGISGRLHYLEYVQDQDLPSLYSGALAFVLPSLHEGFGVPIVEAMACGTPVITSNTSAMPEVAGPAALYVDPESTESIARALTALAGDAALREELRRSGLARVKRFQWAASAEKLYGIFEKITASADSPKGGRAEGTAI